MPQTEPKDSASPISLGAGLARLAAERPDAPAVTCEGTTRSWQELDERSTRLAHALQRRGVKEGDFVTIALPNCPAFAESAYAAWKLGAVPQPVSSKLPAHELRAVLDLAKPSALISLPGLAGGELAISPEEALSGCTDSSPLPDRTAPCLKAPTSGGSTGRPKLIVTTAQGVVDPTRAEFWRVSPGDVVLMPAPLYHNAPFSVLCAALPAGAHLVLLPKFDAETVLREVERHHISWLYVVPTMMTRILHLPQSVRERHDVSSVKCVWHMAAPCPPAVKRAWIEWFGPEVIWELYGGTEAQSVTAINGVDWLARPGSVGRPVIGEMAIFDEAGKQLSPGETGLVYVRHAPGTPPTYRYVGAQADRLGDWETLGDIGRMDADGFLYLTDRRTDMILVGGANVYPAEIEAVIEEHPAVATSAVIGLPDEDLGNRIHAIVQLSGDVEPEALMQHLASRLAPYKRPRSIEFVAEPLKDDAGKVRRFLLRQERLAALAKTPSSQSDSVIR